MRFELHLNILFCGLFLSLPGSDSGHNRNFSSYQEWLGSDCDGHQGKPFSVGHGVNGSHTSDVQFIIGNFAGDKDQCVTLIGKAHTH